MTEVGVDTLRLLRFCSRPRRCTGYDIADYRAMRPDNGTLADTRRFVNEANKRWMDVMTELVIALTSDQIRCRGAWPTRLGWSERHGYIWSGIDDRYAERRILVIDTEVSNGASEEVV
jgi:glycosidase